MSGFLYRFFSKIDQSGECWPWTGSKNKQGYGKCRINGKTFRAHRIVWEMYNGPIPKYLLVCHTCDNTSCCNPSHLFLGNHQVNSDDKKRKGRAYKLPAMIGEKNPRARLTVQDIVSIRQMSLTFTYIEIASKLNLPRPTVYNIVKRKTWSHI